MTTGQTGPRESVGHVAEAERAGCGLRSEGRFRIIRALLTGEYATRHGRHADVVITTEPKRGLLGAELPFPAGCDQASEHTRPEDVASIPRGGGADAAVAADRPFAEAGFTCLALVPVGGAHQMPFHHRAETASPPALRDL
ncbi:hypothetical protein [Streptomyces sp. NPDC004284]|uniref:hypothetical protein n=1 Tax=Streptomyces sp. NPDC004284 TaxID=3364695 RepID=UPI0036AEA48E